MYTCINRKYCGKQRNRGENSDNTKAQTFLQNKQEMRVINSCCANVRGNCRGGEITLQDTDDSPLRKRRRK